MNLYICIKSSTAEDLFVGLDGFDVPASVALYNAMLLKQVMDEYPDSDDIHIGPRKPAAWCEFDNGTVSDLPGVSEHVRQIGEKLWLSNEWIVFPSEEVLS